MAFVNLPRAVRAEARAEAVGAEGFALALAMQSLGVLAGSGLGDDKTYGYLMMAIKPDLMLPLDEYRRHMSEMLARVKTTPRQPGVDEIRLPGERSQRERARLKREGIEIDRKIYDALNALPAGRLPPSCSQAQPKRLPQVSLCPVSHQQSRPQSRNDSTIRLSLGDAVRTHPPSPIVT